MDRTAVFRNMKQVALRARITPNKSPHNCATLHASLKTTNLYAHARRGANPVEWLE